MKVIRWILLVVGIALASSLAPLVSGATKPRVAVISFKQKAGFWSGIGDAAQDVLVTQLVQTGKYTVIDRERLQDLMKEKSFSLSGDIDSATAVKLGKMLGVEYLIAGAVTDFSKSDSSTGSGFNPLRHVVNVNTSKVSASIDARAISTLTGEIVWADSAQQSTSSSQIFVDGGGGGSWDNEKAEKVIRPICEKLVASLGKKELGGAAAGPIGKVAMVSADGVFINAGSDGGVEVGQILEVYRPGPAIKDPDTGQILGSEDTRVGELKVVAVKGPHLSLCAPASGTDFQTGDILKAKP